MEGVKLKRMLKAINSLLKPSARIVGIWSIVPLNAAHFLRSGVMVGICITRGMNRQQLVLKWITRSTAQLIIIGIDPNVK
jgi:hypothetical protein